MSKKVLLLLISFISFFVLAHQAIASDDESVPEITVATITEPSNEDKDWPIVHVERSEYIDQETGVTYESVSIVRLETIPTRNTENQSLCQNMSTMACTKSGGSTIYSYSFIIYNGSSITSHLKSWFDYICTNNSNCIYRKPTKMEAWWTRTNTNWSAKNAFAGWGCYACSICEGGTWQSVWLENPKYIPAWQNSTMSFVYVYTSTSYPGLYPANGNEDRASMNSEAYYGTTQKGNFNLNPGFN